METETNGGIPTSMASAAAAGAGGVQGEWTTGYIARPTCSPKIASPSTASGDADHLSDCVQHGISVAEKCSSMKPCLVLSGPKYLP